VSPRIVIMKHNHNHDNGPGAESKLVAIQFAFTHPTAISVCLAGTFNAWHPTTKSMHRSSDGQWLKEAFLPPGDYEYCLVVDGQWMPDPRAGATVPNPFGGKNSVLKVAPTPAAAPRAAAQNSPLKNTNKKTTRKL
jgi:1,4-alpha-glucan branching enzyme